MQDLHFLRTTICDTIHHPDPRSDHPRYRKRLFLTLVKNTLRKLRRALLNTKTTRVNDKFGRIEARLATQQTAVDMDLFFHALFPTSPSSDEPACIDPQLLQLDCNQNTVISPSTANVFNTAGNNLAMPGVVFDETTAGRG
jgi:hypothetical protein